MLCHHVRGDSMLCHRVRGDSLCCVTVFEVNWMLSIVGNIFTGYILCAHENNKESIMNV